MSFLFLPRYSLWTWTVDGRSSGLTNGATDNDYSSGQTLILLKKILSLWSLFTNQFYFFIFRCMRFDKCKHSSNLYIIYESGQPREFCVGVPTSEAMMVLGTTA
jgi:hypothetical protein